MEHIPVKAQNNNEEEVRVTQDQEDLEKTQRKNGAVNKKNQNRFLVLIILALYKSPQIASQAFTEVRLYFRLQSLFNFIVPSGSLSKYFL